MKTGRADIYGGETAGQTTGQAARYWHGEVRQMVTTAVTVYAAGCRAAHRGAQSLDVVDARLRDRWLAADPLVGVPMHRVTTHRSSAVTGGGAIMGDRDMRRALAAEHAAPLGDTVPEVVHYRGTWWITETLQTAGSGPAGEWHAVTDPTAAADLDKAAVRMALADDAVRSSREAAARFGPRERR